MIRAGRRLALLCGVLFAARAEAQQPALVINAGRLLDPVTGTVTRDARILVQNGRVTAVGGRFVAARDARIVDLSGLTVLPGLIDAHVHLGIGGPVRDNALADLRAGFTSVVDLGARTTRLLCIRDSINAGLIPGPRVYAAGIWVGTRGGVCEFNGIGIAGGPDASAALRSSVDMLAHAAYVDSALARQLRREECVHHFYAGVAYRR